MDKKARMACLEEMAPGAAELGSAELDQKVEEQVLRNNESERLICCYLEAINEREVHKEFGFSDIFDYAYERFGYSERKTRYMLSLARKLVRLPKLRAALKEGKIGWCKASLVSRVATSEDEAMWLDSAMSLSVRELERQIREGTDTLASMMSFWMEEDDRAVWENALEICRRMQGADLPPGRALGLVSGEFFATYAHLLPKDDCEDEETEESEESERADAGTESGNGDEAEGEHKKASAHVDNWPGEIKSTLEGALDPEWEKRHCPDKDDELPWPVVRYDEVRWKVLERDHYQCQYPGCSMRSELHVHHIEYRSHAGAKSRGRTNHPSNLITLCVFHHRMVHAKAIGVKGRAPHEIDWKPPKLMSFVLERKRNVPASEIGEFEARQYPSRRRKEPPRPAA